MIFSFIFRQKCVICGCSKEDSYLCKTCAKGLVFSTPFAQRKIDNIEIFSAFLYEGKIKKLIQALKFKHKKGVSKILAKFLWEYFQTLDISNDFLIIPVPSHYKRIWSRGYCHTNEICKEFSKLSKMKMSTKILRKIKNTKPQFELNRDERENNLEGSFKLNQKNLENEKILLIDDITTTGATLEEIISLFEQQKQNIICLTVAKT